MADDDDDLLIGLGDDGRYDENGDDNDDAYGNYEIMDYDEMIASDPDPITHVRDGLRKKGANAESKRSMTRSDDDDHSELSDEDFGFGSPASKSKMKSARSVNTEDEEAEERMMEAQEYKSRLFRRTMILEEVRKSYLRDVILLKQVMSEMFNDEERKAVMAQYESMIPSLDMRQWFQPRAPESTTFKVRPCDLCGGHLEITINVSDELQELRSLLDHQKKVEEKMRLDYATQSYGYEKLQIDKDYQDRNHAQEKSVLYAEMKRLKSEIDTNTDSGILHKRQMQQMKSSIAEHEKTKLKLRAAEMTAHDAVDELKTLRQRSLELAERVQTLESDSMYDKVCADLERLKDEQEANEAAKADMEAKAEATKHEFDELVSYQGRMKEHIGSLEGQVAEGEERVAAKQAELEGLEGEYKQYQADVGVELGELEDKVGGG